MEKVHNVNLQPLKAVRTWDTKRINAYKDRIQKHISYLESTKTETTFDEVVFERFKNYKAELKNILATRENINK